jgi:hypothetical protein
MPFFTFDYQQTLDETISLDDLSNVTVPAPTEGTVLAFDSGSGQWQSRDIFNNVEDSTRSYIHSYPRSIPSGTTNVIQNQMYLATFIAKYDMTITKVSSARLNSTTDAKGWALMRLDANNQPISTSGTFYRNNNYYLPGGAAGTSTTGARYSDSGNAGLKYGGKRWFVVYRITLDANNKATNFTLVGQTPDDFTIFNFDDQVSQKLLESPISLVAGTAYAVGYLISGEIVRLSTGVGPVTIANTGNPGLVKVYSVNYAEDTIIDATVALASGGSAPIKLYNYRVAGATGVADFGISPSYILNVGTTQVGDTSYVSKTILNSPPTSFEGPDTPKTSVSRSYSNGIATLVMNNVDNLYGQVGDQAGTKVAVSGFGDARYDATLDLLSVDQATKTITYWKSPSYRTTTKRAHSGTVATLTMDSVTGLTVGSTIYVTDVGLGYDGINTIASVNSTTLKITYNRTRSSSEAEVADTNGRVNYGTYTTESTTANTNGKLFSQSNANWKRTAAKYLANEYKLPWFRLEV